MAHPRVDQLLQGRVDAGVPDEDLAWRSEHRHVPPVGRERVGLRGEHAVVVTGRVDRNRRDDDEDADHDVPLAGRMYRAYHATQRIPVRPEVVT